MVIFLELWHLNCVQNMKLIQIKFERKNENKKRKEDKRKERDNPHAGPESWVRPTRDVPLRGPTIARAAQRRQAGPTSPSWQHADHVVRPSLACEPVGSAPHLSSGFTAPCTSLCCSSLPCGPEGSALPPQQPRPSMEGAPVPRGMDSWPNPSPPRLYKVCHKP